LSNAKVQAQRKKHQQQQDKRQRQQRTQLNIWLQYSGSWLALMIAVACGMSLGAIATQNFANIAVLCPSQESPCMWLRFDTKKFLMPYDNQ
jgi:hypothetical protein